MPESRDNLRQQSLVMLHAGVVGGATRWAGGNTVSAHGARVVLWALWLIQIERGPDVRLTSIDIGEAAGVIPKTAGRALFVLQKQGVIECLDPRLHVCGRGTRWRIVWERLVEMVPAENLPSPKRKSAA